MGFAADVVFEADVVAQGVDEAHLQIPAVVLRIVNGDDVLKLGRADPADALHCAHLVGMRRTGRIEEGLFVEACGVNHQQITHFGTRQQARRVLLASVIYLPVLFSLMLFDRPA